jgi:hypothetical protein
LPWAGIRFLLEVTVSDFNAAQLILEHATSLAEMIPRYEIFEQIFLQSPSSATSELERGLTALYAKMLLYLAKAKAHFLHGTLSRFSPLPPLPPPRLWTNPRQNAQSRMFS